MRHEATVAVARAHERRNEARAAQVRVDAIKKKRR
jgi:hypothetical protein